MRKTSGSAFVESPGLSAENLEATIPSADKFYHLALLRGWVIEKLEEDPFNP